MKYIHNWHIQVIFTRQNAEISSKNQVSSVMRFFVTQNTIYNCEISIITLRYVNIHFNFTLTWKKYAKNNWGGRNVKLC